MAERGKDWAEAFQDKVDLLQAGVGREVMLRLASGAEGAFYVVAVHADSAQDVNVEGHFSIPRWRSFTAWSSCALLLFLVLTSPIAVVAALKLNWWTLLLPYPAVVPLYMISIALFSPRCLLTVEGIAAISAVD